MGRVYKWKSEDNLVELGLSSTFLWVLEIKIRLPGFWSKILTGWAISLKKEDAALQW